MIERTEKICYAVETLQVKQKRSGFNFMHILELYDFIASRKKRTDISVFGLEKDSEVAKYCKASAGIRKARLEHIQKHILVDCCLPYAIVWGTTQGCERHQGKFLLINRNYSVLGVLAGGTANGYWWDSDYWQRNSIGLEPFCSEGHDIYYFYSGRLGLTRKKEYEQNLNMFAQKIPVHDVSYAINLRMKDRLSLTASA